MSQLQTIPGDHQAVSTEASPAARKGRKGRQATLTCEERQSRIRERNRIQRLIWSVPPVNLECDCGEPATLWNSAKDAICARCNFLYSLAKRMEIHGRMIGLHRKPRLESLIIETQMELFLSDVVYLADEIKIVGHGVYHLHIEKEAA